MSLRSRSGRIATGLVGAAAMITAITLLSRILGFSRWMVQAGTVGYGATGTAYASANALPNVLFEVAAGGALAGAVIPLLAAPLARGARAEVDRIASAALTWTATILVPLAVLVAVLAGPLVTVFLGEGAPEAQLELTAHFLRVFAWQVPLYGLGVVLTGVLQAQKRFFWPAFVPVLSTLVVIGAYLVFGATADGAQDDLAALPARAVAWLAWGTTAGVVALSVPLLLPTARSGVRLRLTWRFPEGVARRARKLAAAGVVAVLAQQLSLVATIWLANNRGGDGTFAVYQYTQAVYVLPHAVLVVPLVTSAFPRIADVVGQPERLARLVSLTTRAVLVLGAVGASALVAAAPQVARVFSVVGHGDDRVIAAMAPALSWMAPGLVGLGIMLHLTRVLYALERSRAAVLASSVGWAVGIVTSAVLSVAATWGGRDAAAALVALGIGGSVGMVVGAVAALVVLRRAAGPDASQGVARTAVVVAGVGAAGAVAGRVVADAVTQAWAGTTGTLVAGAVGGLLAVGVALAGAWVADRSSVREMLGRTRGGAAAPAAQEGERA
ncbi:putative peptidoglycan lipid II flippase [Flavimobilis soli]|uniref:Putative peptidoglycan lipid II flippase n=1 Tax=Flavimobilis soli TaxID=442709 RepID=A0A2A9EAZ2_9MICO|nr:putative peptidoglycan lipid II flippase [Flavimobilis soli]